MRILHLAAEKTWRGGENQLRLLLTGLKAQGVTNYVATLPESPTAERLKALATIVPISRAGYHFGQAYRLARFARVQEISLIDAHTSQTHSLGLLIKAMNPSVKLVVHRRVDNSIKSNPLTRWKYLSPKIDQYVAISSAIKQILIDYGVASQKIAVVKSAVAMSEHTKQTKSSAKAALAHKYQVNPEKIFIGNASALEPQKDPQALLEACVQLKKHGLSFHAFIAGDGSLREQLSQFITAQGLSDSVQLTGFLSDVSDFLLGLDIVAVPSVNEGLGTTILDSIVARCAVVASAVGGIPEIILDGQTGLLVSPRNPADLGHKLTELIMNPKLRDHLVANARLHIQENFSLDRMIGGNKSVYDALLKSSD